MKQIHIYRIRPMKYNEIKIMTQVLQKYVLDSYTRNAGYVNPTRCKGHSNKLFNIVDFNFASIKQNEYIWVGNEDRNWNV